MKKVIIVGAGIAGLSAATDLAHAGFDVTVLEKNDKPGGRINFFEHEGFKFEMGPSWYWMPEVFENFFKKHGYTASDFYDLKRLDPSYKVVFPDSAALDLPADFSKLQALFEEIEAGSGEKLKSFLDDAAYKYEVGMNEFVWKPANSIFEFAQFKVLKSLFKLQLLQSISKEIKAIVKDDRLRQILEFPVLFLGATPKDTPALYSLMNYADMSLGTWYPIGGMSKIIEGMVSVAKELGINFITNSPIDEIIIKNKKVFGIKTNEEIIKADYVVSGADYHHTEKLLLPEYRNYNEKYWDKRVMAPSSLLYYVGLNKKIEGIKHHNLFFDESFDNHAVEIYDTHKWPEAPLFYVCNPSKTDTSVAPEGKENLFFLVPVSTELKDNEATKQRYFNMICDRLEKHTGEDVRPHIEVYESFAHSDFVQEYNSFKGNAYGLANTLKQTAILKPKCKNKKLDNLYYIGQLTIPGPGVPPSIISGKIVADLIKQEQHNYESII